MLGTALKRGEEGLSSVVKGVTGEFYGVHVIRRLIRAGVEADRSLFEAVLGAVFDRGCRAGEVKELVAEAARRGLLPTRQTVGVVVERLQQDRRHQEAREVLKLASLAGLALPLPLWRRMIAHLDDRGLQSEKATATREMEEMLTERGRTSSEKLWLHSYRGDAEGAERAVEDNNLRRRRSRPNLHGWSLLAGAYYRQGGRKGEEGLLNVLRRMRQAGCKLTSRELNMLLHLKAKRGDASGVVEVRDWMTQLGVELNGNGRCHVLNAYGRSGDVAEAQRCFDRFTAERSCSEETKALLMTTLIAAYVRSGDVDSARRKLGGVRAQLGIAPTVDMYNALLGGVARARPGDLASVRALMAEMKAAGLVPNGRTCTALLQATMQAQDADRALRFLHCMERHYDVTPQTIHYNIVLEALTRHRGDGPPRARIARAEQLLGTMAHPDFCSFIPLVRAYAGSGDVDAVSGTLATLARRWTRPLTRSQRLQIRNALLRAYKAGKFGPSPRRQRRARQLIDTALYRTSPPSSSSPSAASSSSPSAPLASSSSSPSAPLASSSSSPSAATKRGTGP